MIYRFSDLDLDTGSHKLSRAGAPIKLTSLTYRVLLALVESAPDLVSYDQLVDRAWGSNRVVSPENLSQRIMMLRQSLGDQAQSPRYIEAVRGEGFRLVPEVTKHENGPTEVKPASSKSNLAGKPSGIRYGIFVIALVILVVTMALIAVFSQDNHYQREPGAGRPGNSVAVLPFANLSSDANYEFYAAGIHEEVLNQLVKHTSLRVISRTSMMRYKDTEKSVPEIAAQLQVDSVIEGSVRYSQNRIRVTIQLVDGLSDEHFWSETYERQVDDIFSIETDIARNVARALGALTEDESKRPASNPATDNLEAYEAYQRGRQAARLRNTQGLPEALILFEKARELDPNYVQAWVAIADTLDLLALYTSMNVADTLARRQTAINRALELDSTSGAAWLSLAKISEDKDKQVEAETYFKRSIKLEPGYSQAYHWYGLFLLYQGRAEEALPKLRIAISLDPFSPSANTALARTLWSLGETEEALLVHMKTVDLAPSYAGNYFHLAKHMRKIGRLDEAMYWFNVAARLRPDLEHYRLEQCYSLLSLGDDDSARSCRKTVEQLFPDAGTQGLWPESKLYEQKYSQLLSESQERFLANPDAPGVRFWLAFAHLLNGNEAKARELFAHIWPELFNANSSTLSLYGIGRPIVIVGIVLYANGDIDGANRLFDSALTHAQSIQRTLGEGYGMFDVYIHATRGDTRKAISALQQAIDSGWREDWWQIREPFFERLQGDPQWQALVSELEADIERQRNNFNTHKDGRAFWLCKAGSSLPSSCGVSPHGTK